MIIVTGGAGFIGSNLIRSLNERGEDDIVVVDELSNSVKIQNLRNCRFVDYIDMDDFRTERHRLGKPRAIFHQGACSNTMELDGRYMMDVNYNYSKDLLHFCLEQGVPLIYASSASVYGAGTVFKEHASNEDALNVYAFSKLLFDRYAARFIPQAGSQIVGLRYFNVYGPGESHKGRMASVAWHFSKQYRDEGKVHLFVGSGGYGDGEQERDFIWVGDVAKVNLHFLDHPDVSGIYNIGTGISRSFNDVALAVINTREDSGYSVEQAVKGGKIEYIPFPDGLRERYQSYTCADISSLRSVGYDAQFVEVEEGVGRYVKRLMENDGA